MRLRTFAAAMAMGLLLPTSLSAQAVKSELQASNGVPVTVYTDDFAGRYEYTAPKIDIPGGGFALVAAVKQNGKAMPTKVVGNIMYRGEWRHYHSAILRGGEAVEGIFNDRDVISCAGSRYSGCYLAEGFNLTLTAEQIAKFAQDGKIDIQFRATSGEAVMVSVPLSYFAALDEAVKG